MNIQQAIVQIESTIRAYTARRQDGLPLIPIAAQRPVYLEGPPGIGKTAIMAQIAQRLNIALVAYTMTHHTRQSALGLPVIEKRCFEGREYAITEYTMSEIVAEVYRQMEQTGCRQGILFLDEINCVSETLMPAMLELLQHKRFGQHPLPEGWVIVCAGNPEKYNRNARTFDAVTLDRVRLMRIEPDVTAWQVYAEATGVHPSIRAYLRLRPEDFYTAEDTNIVTPRSWCDLSHMIDVLQSNHEVPGKMLFEQYIQCPSICERFTLYYAMCENVARNFQLDCVIFEGNLTSAAHFAAAPFDEALCCAEMLAQRLHVIEITARQARQQSDRLGYFADAALKAAGEQSLTESCQNLPSRREHALEVRREVNALSDEDAACESALHQLIRQIIADMLGSDDPILKLRQGCQSAEARAQHAEADYLQAKHHVQAFSEAAFSKDSLQSALCREIIAQQGQ